MLIKLICIAVALLAEAVLLKYMYDLGFDKASDMVDVAIDTQELMRNVVIAGKLLDEYTPDELKAAVRWVEINKEKEEGE